jgi:heterodisulfide reductase subunit A-like polyferredoxin
MATNPKWVLTCKNCRAECTYEEIPSDTESYFLPKRPHVPADFAHRCGICGHEYAYQRNDLSYRDETMPSRMDEKKCGAGESAEPPERAFGAAK